MQALIHHQHLVREMDVQSVNRNDEIYESIDQNFGCCRFLYPFKER